MNTTTAGTGRRRSGLAGAVWAVAMIAGMLLFPGGGLLVSIVAVCTSYRHSTRRTKAVLLGVGALTLVLTLVDIFVTFSGSMTTDDHFSTHNVVVN